MYEGYRLQDPKKCTNFPNGPFMFLPKSGKIIMVSFIIFHQNFPFYLQNMSFFFILVTEISIFFLTIWCYYVLLDFVAEDTTKNRKRVEKIKPKRNAFNESIQTVRISIL
jgi:hypothetical protein